MMQENGMNRLAGAVVALGLFAACEKHDAAAGQAAGALNKVDGQAGQKFDQAANYVGQQVDSVKQAAQQNLQSAGTLPDMSASAVWPQPHGRIWTARRARQTRPLSMPQATLAQACRLPAASCWIGPRARPQVKAWRAERRERVQAVRRVAHRVVRPLCRRTLEMHARIWTNRWPPARAMECATGFNAVIVGSPG